MSWLLRPAAPLHAGLLAPSAHSPRAPTPPRAAWARAGIAKPRTERAGFRPGQGAASASLPCCWRARWAAVLRCMRALGPGWLPAVFPLTPPERRRRPGCRLCSMCRLCRLPVDCHARARTMLLRRCVAMLACAAGACLLCLLGAEPALAGQAAHVEQRRAVLLLPPAAAWTAKALPLPPPSLSLPRHRRHRGPAPRPRQLRRLDQLAGPAPHRGSRAAAAGGGRAAAGARNRRGPGRRGGGCHAPRGLARRRALCCSRAAGRHPRQRAGQQPGPRRRFCADCAWRGAARAPQRRHALCLPRTSSQPVGRLGAGGCGPERRGGRCRGGAGAAPVPL